MCVREIIGLPLSLFFSMGFIFTQKELYCSSSHLRKKKSFRFKVIHVL